jgi:hypothetical protein
MLRTLSKFGSFAKIRYKTQPIGISLTSYMNRSCTLWILPSIHKVRSMIVVIRNFV